MELAGLWVLVISIDRQKSNYPTLTDQCPTFLNQYIVSSNICQDVAQRRVEAPASEAHHLGAELCGAFDHRHIPVLGVSEPQYLSQDDRPLGRNSGFEIWDLYWIEWGWIKSPVKTHELPWNRGRGSSYYTTTNCELG